MSIDEGNGLATGNGRTLEEYRAAPRSQSPLKAAERSEATLGTRKITNRENDHEKLHNTGLAVCT